MQSNTLTQKKPVFGHSSPDKDFSSEFYQPYRAAVETAFMMLCRARSLLSEESGEEAIRQMTFRLKSPGSISDKLRKKHLPVTPDAASAALHDVAGLRVVLTSIEAVYRYAQLLIDSPLAEFIASRDYIAEPKPSGYRSLHLLMMVPVVSHGQHIMTPVEIQLRTSDMDAWAVVEHDIFYKPQQAAADSPHEVGIAQ